MAKQGINKVILVGNLGNDPETRFFPDGGAITNASLATSESWNNKQSGEKQERTEWHRLVFKDRGNYKMGQYAGELRKGAKLYIEGSLHTRMYEKDGQKHYTTEILVSEMQSLSPREHSDSHQQDRMAAPMGGGQTAMGQANYAAQQNMAARNAVPQQGAGGQPSFDPFVDDGIPF